MQYLLHDGIERATTWLTSTPKVLRSGKLGVKAWATVRRNPDYFVFSEQVASVPQRDGSGDLGPQMLMTTFASVPYVMLTCALYGTYGATAVP